MNQQKLTRFVAIACVLTAFPIVFLSVPWLPATVIDFIQTWHAPVPAWATDNFRAWREARLHHLEIALALYALGLAAVGGLAAVAAKLLLPWAESLVWIVTASTALGISGFEQPAISARTDPTYAFMMVRLPIIIAGVAGLGAIVNLCGIISSRSPRCVLRD